MPPGAGSNAVRVQGLFVTQISPAMHGACGLFKQHLCELLCLGRLLGLQLTGRLQSCSWTQVPADIFYTEAPKLRLPLL